GAPARNTRRSSPRAGPRPKTPPGRRTAPTGRAGSRAGRRTGPAVTVGPCPRRTPPAAERDRSPAAARQAAPTAAPRGGARHLRPTAPPRLRGVAKPRRRPQGGRGPGSHAPADGTGARGVPAPRRDGRGPALE